MAVLTPEEYEEMLIRMDERLGAVHHAVMGNGQPGLKQDVAVLKGTVAAQGELLADVNRRVPTKKGKFAAATGVISAVVIAVVTALGNTRT